MIKGEKIVLRACEPEDLDLLYEWENDTTMWNVTNTYIPFTRATLRKYLDSIQDIYSDKQLRLIILQDSKPVGMLDLFDYEPHHGRAGIGILIADSSDRGKGLATDALTALQRYSKEVLAMRILFCNVLESNRASRQLFEKCGFAQVGVKPKWHRSVDAYEDEIMYQILL